MYKSNKFFIQLNKNYTFDIDEDDTLNFRIFHFMQNISRTKNLDYFINLFFNWLLLFKITLYLFTNPAFKDNSMKTILYQPYNIMRISFHTNIS